MKMAVFWVVAPCSLVEVYDVSEVFAASIIRTIVGKLLPDYKAQQPSRQLFQRTSQFVWQLLSLLLRRQAVQVSAEVAVIPWLFLIADLRFLHELTVQFFLVHTSYFFNFIRL
jgi:hypothetical protein